MLHTSNRLSRTHRQKTWRKGIKYSVYISYSFEQPTTRNVPTVPCIPYLRYCYAECGEIWIKIDASLYNGCIFSYCWGDRSDMHVLHDKRDKQTKLESVSISLRNAESYHQHHINWFHSGDCSIRYDFIFRISMSAMYCKSSSVRSYLIHK